MKGRPKSIRKISFVPPVSGFRPFGGNPDHADAEPVTMTYEEFEALRLNDYEKQIQCEAAEVMGVSRPTYTRIYMSAREKIAKAFVEGRPLEIRGGKVELESGWYICKACHAVFTHPGREEEVICGLCGSKDVRPYELPSANQTDYRPRNKKCCHRAQQEKESSAD